jgi:hypothetical protein
MEIFMVVSELARDSSRPITDSYVQCLAHVLNLVKDILRDLGSGNRAEANDACDSPGSRFSGKSSLEFLIWFLICLWMVG